MLQQTYVEMLSKCALEKGVHRKKGYYERVYVCVWICE